MKTTRECPECEGTTFYTIDPATIPDFQYRDSVRPFTLAAAYMETGETGFLGDSKRDRLGVTVEAWVCAGCGLTRMYAKDLELLARMEREGVAGVGKVEGE